MIKLVELFSGSRTISQVAERFGIRTLSIDRDINDGINWNVDLRDVTASGILERLREPGHGRNKDPDIIWSSPPCNTWSKLNWWRHFDRYVYKKSRIFLPVTETCYNGIACLEKTIDIILNFQNAIFFIENPEGLMSKHPLIQRLCDHRDVKTINRFTVTYCKYGFPHRKPTHIWTNSSFVPIPYCKKNESCHVGSPRSMPALHSIKGNSYERSKVPIKLAEECIKAALCDVTGNRFSVTSQRAG